MAVYVEWDVFMGTFTSQYGLASNGIPNSATEFTSRIISMSVNTNIEIGEFGRSSATVTLDNTDGAFTPGGGGTYEDWDFLANPVWIRARTGTNPASLTAQMPMFTGVVSGVQFRDDGFSAEVEVQCDDVFSLVQRSVFLADYDNLLSPAKVHTLISSILNLTANVVALPKFGSYYTFYPADYYTPVGDSSPFTMKAGEDLEISVSEGEFVGDRLTDIVVGEHGVAFPMWLFAYHITGFPSFASMYYQQGHVARDWLWSGTATYPAFAEFEFVEGTPSGTQLPFSEPKVGFSIDQLITKADVTAPAGILQSAEQATATQQYGVRTVSFSDMALQYDAQALELAEHLVARYSTVRFGVVELLVTGGQILNQCADAALTHVNWLVTAPTVGNYQESTVASRVLGPLFHPASITFTGAGGVSLDSRVAFFNMTLDVDQTDWSLRLGDGRPAKEAFGFVIGESNYGVLGTNRVA